MKAQKHPKCRGEFSSSPSEEPDFECGYNTEIECDECKYGFGKKDPEATCNQPEIIRGGSAKLDADIIAATGA